MKEAEWLTCRDPAQLIGYAGRGKESRRSLRLLAVAFARPLAPVLQEDYPRTDFNRFLDTAEEFAERKIDRLQFLRAVTPIRRMLPPLNSQCRPWFEEREFIALLDWRLSDVFVMLTYEALDYRWAAIVGTLEAFARDTAQPREAVARMEESLCHLTRDVFRYSLDPVAFDPAWRTSDVMLLARGIYEEKAFDRMPILADALQDAECDNNELLGHLRDPNATHVRGCWALDLVLEKE